MSDRRETDPRSDSSTPIPGKATQHFDMSGVGKHAAVYAFGVFLERGASFVMLPVYTEFLSTEDYGVMGLILMTLDFITILAGAMIVSGVFRYFHKEETQEGKYRVVSTAHISLLLSYAAVSVICFFASDFLANLVFGDTQHAWLIRIASGAIFAQSLPIIPLSYAQVNDRSKLFVSASAARLLLAVLFNVIFLAGLGWGVESMFVSTIISQGAVGLYLNWGLVREVGIRFHRPTMKLLMRFSAPIIATQFAGFIYGFGDRYVLQAVSGESAVGVLHVAYRFAQLLLIVAAGPFARVWHPKRFEIAKRPDKDVLLSRGFMYQSLGVLTAFVGVSVFVEEVVALMTSNPEFEAAAVLVPVLMVAFILQAWGGIQNLGIMYTEKTKFILLSDIVAAAAAVVAYIVLIPRYFGMGAVLATVVAYAVRWAMVYNISQRLWYVRYEWAPVLKIAALAGTTFVASRFVQVENVYLSIAIKSGLVLLYFVSIWFAGLLNEREKSWILAFPGRGGAALLALIKRDR